MKSPSGPLEALARLLLSGIYLYIAVYDLTHPAEAMSLMMDLNIPGVPVFFIAALTLLLLGSIGLALGYRTRSAAFSLLLLSIVEAFLQYPPWSSGHLEMFLLRCSVMGGLLLVLANGGGPWSFDARSMVPVRRKRN